MPPADFPLPGEDLMQLLLERIRLDGGTQSRARLDPHHAAELAEVLAGGKDLPPVVVFFDGSHYWLASGFHRWHAHQQAGRKYVEAVVRHGTVRDARLFSCGCNAAHGLRRTNDDKRHAVALMLADPDWSAWSNRGIAEHCGVSEFLVRSIKGEDEEDEEDEEDCDKNADVPSDPGEEGADEAPGEAAGPADQVEPADALDHPDDVPSARAQALRSARKFVRQARRLARLERRPASATRAELLRRADAAEAGEVRQEEQEG